MRAKTAVTIPVYLVLHAMLAVYSLSSVCSKLAAGQPFMSAGFMLIYGASIALLAVYAIVWQQVIKRMPLTTAYANKAVTLVWGLVWGRVIFEEELSPIKLLGAAVVLAGVVMFSMAHDEDDDARGEGARP